MLHLMDIIGFQQIGIHHSVYLLPQPEHQLHARGCQVHARQGKDRAKDYQRSYIPKVTSKKKADLICTIYQSSCREMHNETN